MRSYAPLALAGTDRLQSHRVARGKWVGEGGGTYHGGMEEAGQVPHIDASRLSYHQGLLWYVHQIIQVFMLMFSSITKDGIEDFAVAGLRKHPAGKLLI